MFFSISKQLNNDFPNHIKWGEFCIDFDNGWAITSNSISKGYPEKSCLISYNNNQVTINSGQRQTFPLFIDDEQFVVSNIEFGQFFVGEVTVTPSAILKTPTAPLEFTNLNLTDTEIISNINDVITNTFLNFKQTSPFKLFLTGGVDTILLASYVVKNNIPYELVTYEHFDLDYFMCYNRSKLKNFWAYKSLQHWKETTTLLSGANGDEMMLRNPYDAYLILKHYGEDLVSACRQQHYYHNSHFLKSKNIAEYIKLTSTSFASDIELKNYVLKRNSVDFQHWHLGNTITFTPFDNLEITNLMLNLSYPALRSQLLDAGISKELIKLNAPELLKYLSDDKNSNNFKKLAGLFEGTETL